MMVACEQPFQNKNTIKNYLLVEESSRTGENPDLIVLDRMLEMFVQYYG